MNHSLIKSAFVSPLARQYLIWIFLFGSILTFAFTGLELAIQYRSQTSVVQSEIETITRTYTNNLSRAVWQLNSDQAQDMLDYLVLGTSVTAAYVEGDVMVLQAGDTPGGSYYESSEELAFEFMGERNYLGEFKVLASLKPIYSGLYFLALNRLGTNLLRSLIVIAFSFFAFQLLVNRHLMKIAQAIESGLIVDPQEEKLGLERVRFAYSRHDELDQVADSLNDARAQLRSQLEKTEAAYTQLDNVARKHAGDLDAIGVTLHALRHFVSFFGPDGRSVLSEEYQIGDPDLCDENIKQLISSPHKEPESAKIAAERAGLRCNYSSQRVSEWGSDIVQFFLELEDRTNQHWLLNVVVFPSGSVGIQCADVTELKHSQSELSHVHKIDALGTLTGGVAHDFNNILSVILGNIELLQFHNENTKLEEFADAVESACIRGSRLTAGLLSFARKSPLKKQILDINGNVKAVLSWGARVIPENIELEVSLQARVWNIEGDSPMIENALLNLVLNARDAMTEGGKLTIESSNLRVDEDDIWAWNEDIKPGRYVLLAVSDTGTGIQEKTLSKIFDPFFTTKNPGKGSGVGLSMVHGFMKQSGGTVRIYTEIGVGTTFKLFFPAVFSGKVKGKQVKLVENIAKQTKGTRILFVEDAEDIRRMIGKQLAYAGYITSVAKNGDEALEILARETDIELILTDIVMPGKLNGVALVREARKFRPEIISIFMSGYAEEAAVHGNGLRPEDVRLTKPVHFRKLIEAIESALASQQKQLKIDRPDQSNN